MDMRITVVFILSIAVCNGATQTVGKCDVNNCFQGFHIGNLCNDWMLQCIKREYLSCGDAEGRKDVVLVLQTLIRSPMCKWKMTQVMGYITGRSLMPSVSSSMTSTRSKRSPQESATFNLNSLMTSMADLQRNRMSAMNTLMNSMWNGTGGTGTGSNTNLNPLLMGDMDDGPFDDGPFEDVFDDDGIFDDGPFEDGMGIAAMLPGSPFNPVTGKVPPPLAPKIRIDGGGAAMIRDQQSTGASTSRDSQTWLTTLALICLVGIMRL